MAASLGVIVEAVLLAMARLSPSALLAFLVGWLASYEAAGSDVSHVEVRRRTSAAVQERTYEVMETLATMEGVSQETAAALEKMGASCHRAQHQQAGGDK